MSKKINLLNPEDAASFTKRMARNYPPHVSAWATSTLARWLTGREDLSLQCCSYVEYQSPTMVLLRRVMEMVSPSAVTGLHQQFWPIDEADLPDWAKPVLARNELHRWSAPNEEETSKIIHMLDFCTTLPERQIKATVDVIQTKVVAWDKQLARQKMIESLPDDVEFVRDFDNGDFMVKLLTQNAYAAEGAVMSHCVGTYWGRDRCTIFSLRRPTEKRPVATIELRGSNCIAQVQGYRNQTLPEEDMELIKLWAAENQMFFDESEDDEDEGCDYGDEEECDEDDEDEGCDDEECDEDDEDEDDDCEEEDEDEEEEDERPRPRKLPYRRQR